LSLYERENLTYTILLGHSYGGSVAGGVPDSFPTKVSALIYLDAVVPIHGKSILNFQFDERRKSLLAQAVDHNGWHPPPQPPISLYGILIQISRSGQMPIAYHNR
jgi:pimeloyl-ACP methyl ester carboxylesterase